MSLDLLRTRRARGLNSCQLFGGFGQAQLPRSHVVVRAGFEGNQIHGADWTLARLRKFDVWVH